MKEVKLNIPDEIYDKIVEIAKKDYRTPELQILYFIDKGMNLKNSSPIYFPPGIRSPLIPTTPITVNVDDIKN